MLTITKLKMWKDPGYTRECVEVPPAGSRKLPAPDYTAPGPIRPHKDSTLQSLELPLKYSDVMDMSYMYAEFLDSSGSDDTGNTFSIFGWVMNVELIACAQDNVRIRWTPDYWRTYAGNGTIRRGTLRRVEPTTSMAKKIRRPYGRRPILRHASTLRNRRISDDGINWAIVIYTRSYTYGTNPVKTGTMVDYFYWPIETTVTYSGQTWNTIPYRYLYTGLTEELLELDPQAIIGVYIVPFAPFEVGDSYMGYRIVQYTPSGGSLEKYLVYATKKPEPKIHDVTFTSVYDWMTFPTDDLNESVVTDEQGNIGGRIPYGYTVDGYRGWIDVGTVSVTIMLALKNKTGTDYDELGQQNDYKTVNGCTVSLPAVRVPVTSNAYQSYNYSGQRDFEVEQRRIQRDQTAVSGYAGIASNVAGGALGGAMIGNVAGGAAVGGISSLIGTTANYYISRQFDDQLQKATDDRYAKQTNNITLPAAGSGWLASFNYTTCGPSWRFVVMEPDEGSIWTYEDDMTFNGVECYAITTGPSDSHTPVDLATYTGPLTMTELVLLGNIPPTAKAAIKTKLENGVYIIERNPTGTDPGA